VQAVIIGSKAAAKPKPAPAGVTAGDAAKAE
jgi:hypothetical protein